MRSTGSPPAKSQAAGSPMPPNKAANPANIQPPSIVIQESSSFLPNSTGHQAPNSARLTRRETVISRPFYRENKTKIRNQVKATEIGLGVDSKTSFASLRMDSLIRSNSKASNSSLSQRLTNWFHRKKRGSYDVNPGLDSEVHQAEPYIRIIGNEGKTEFKMGMAAVGQNEHIANKVKCFQYMKAEDGISLVYQARRIPEKLLRDVVKYSNIHKTCPIATHFEDDQNPLNGVPDEQLGFLPPGDWVFAKGKRRARNYLVKLLQASVDVGNENLILMTTNLLAMKMAGMSLKSMRRFMGVDRDLNEKDFKRIAYENRFLIAADSDSEPDKDVAMMFSDLVTNNVFDQLDVLEVGQVNNGSGDGASLKGSATTVKEN